MLTQARIKELVTYDPNTGEFTRNIRISNKINIGDKAGWLSKEGYIRLRLEGKSYSAHRVAWFYMIGEWPKHEIDHIDTIKTNNKWNNLREATHQENCRNIGLRKNNKTGIKGIHQKGSKFRATIQTINGPKHLGYFTTKEEAAIAHNKAANKLHGNFTHHSIKQEDNEKCQ